jgi:hypothetical protein
MKVKGSELIQFMAEAWPGEDKEETKDDWYWDHEVFEEPDPEATYETDELGPILFSRGSGREDPTDGEGLNLATLIKRWRKARAFDMFLIQVPKDKTAEVKEALVNLGCKIA